MTGVLPGLITGVLLTLAAQTLGLLVLEMRDANRRARRRR